MKYKWDTWGFYFSAFYLKRTNNVPVPESQLNCVILFHLFFGDSQLNDAMKAQEDFTKTYKFISLLRAWKDLYYFIMYILLKGIHYMHKLLKGTWLSSLLGVLKKKKDL